MRRIRQIVAWLIAPVAALPVCVWTRFHERRIRRTGRSLCDSERLIATRCGVEFPDRLFVLEADEIPNPLGGLFRLLARHTSLCIGQAAAITFRYGICVVSGRGADSRLLCHEFAHTSQYERLGGHFAFLRLYLCQCLTVGYHDAPLEAEARAVETLEISDT